MRIVIRDDEKAMSELERERLERLLRYGLTRYKPELRMVEVQLDGQGERGRRVVIRARLGSSPDIIVQDVETELPTAVNRAVGRAARAVRQRVLNPYEPVCPPESGAQDAFTAAETRPLARMPGGGR